MPAHRLTAQQLFRRAYFAGPLGASFRFDTRAETKLPSGPHPTYVLRCIRCAGLTSLAPCDNCGSTLLTNAAKKGVVTCEACDLGFARWTCAACGTDNPTHNTFGRLEVRGRVDADALATLWLFLVPSLGFVAFIIGLISPHLPAIGSGMVGALIGVVGPVLYVLAIADWQPDVP